MNKIILSTILFVFVGISSIFAADCKSFTDEASCKKEKGCSWVQSESKCAAKSSGNPSEKPGSGPKGKTQN